MTKEREALKLVLEALQYIYEGANNQGPHTGISWRCVSKKAEPAITAIREALAEQPAQTPVAVYRAGLEGEPYHVQFLAHMEGDEVFLYTSPQPAQPSKPWVGLTDVERAEVQYEAHKKKLTPLEFMELHEAKLREKNA